MKKSLVISTIATVLVVVVALTTATFAWFSASTVSQFTSNFTVQQAGGGVNIYLWDKTGNADQGAWSTSPVIDADEFALGTYTANFEWAASAAGQGEVAPLVGEGNYIPMMPVDQIDTSSFDLSTGVVGSNGLANHLFAHAKDNGDNTVDVDAVELHPITAHFRLDALFAETDATIVLTIGAVSDTPSSSDIYAVRNIKFLLAGKVDTPSETANNILLATNYEYMPNDVAINESYAEGNYASNETTFATAAASEPNGYVVTEVIDDLGTYSSADSSTTINFKMTNAQSMDCVLYIWLDGAEINNAASLGNFEITLNISGKNAAQSP